MTKLRTSIAAAVLAAGTFGAGSAMAAGPGLSFERNEGVAESNVTPVYGGCGWGYAPRYTPWGPRCVYVGAPAYRPYHYNPYPVYRPVPVYPTYRPYYYRPYYHAPRPPGVSVWFRF